MYIDTDEIGSIKLLQQTFLHDFDINIPIENEPCKSSVANLSNFLMPYGRRLSIEVRMSHFSSHKCSPSEPRERRSDESSAKRERKGRFARSRARTALRGAREIRATRGIPGLT